MKRLLNLIFISLLLVNSLFSQEKKNQFGFDLNMNIPIGKYSNKNYGNAATGFGFSGHYNYFTSPKFSIGGEIGYLSFSDKASMWEDYDLVQSYSVFPILGRANIYFSDNHNFRPYIATGIGIAIENYSMDYDDGDLIYGGDGTITPFALKVGLGCDKNLSGNVFAFLNVNYMIIFSDGQTIDIDGDKAEITTNTEFIGINLGLKF